MYPVLILCGGAGTRLSSLISDVPKPMAPINGIPFLSILLNYLVKQGVTEVVLLSGHMSNTIESYYGNKFKNIAISYSVEEQPLGTGGSVLNALKLINQSEFILINGDTYFEINLSDFYKSNLKDKDVVIAVKNISEDDRYNFIHINKYNEVVSISAKHSQDSGYINGGIIKLKKDIFLNLKMKNFSLENFLFDRILSLNNGVLISDSKFIDIGIPSDFAEAQRYLFDESEELK
jgi:D-glycero-alpha-D-manno-heptose 1-phosphate guanylyltransferase